MLILDRSVQGRSTNILNNGEEASVPENIQRKSSLPHLAVSELEAVRHYTGLSQKNMCIETNFFVSGLNFALDCFLDNIKPNKLLL